MGAQFTGQVHKGEGRYAIIVARFNELVTERLLAGAMAGFQQHGISVDRVDVASVPGSFEIPLVARRMADSGRYAAIVCLGAVIRGQTPHFDHVANQAAAGVARAAYDSGVPVIFAILTTDTLEQALDRAGAKSGNKGYQASVDAIEMADLLRRIDCGSGEPP
jgi:6,7-dimethyl-8-ribityllumazine synthase